MNKLTSFLAATSRGFTQNIKKASAVDYAAVIEPEQLKLKL